MSEILRRTIPATTVGAYLMSVPEERRPAPLLVGFHGYGENAETCLAELHRIPGSSAFLIVAVQALHRFYNAKNREMVGSWMTKIDREQAIADNVRYVASVLAAVAREIAGDGRLVYLGFSQGTSMAYRAAAHASRAAEGIIALGGDVPPDVGDDPAVTLPPVLIGRGLGDDWYTAEKLAADLDRLRARGTEVEVARFDGGHEWTDDFRKAAAAFLRRVAPLR
ncbi:MAG: dienelactone hydrolase family protein [Thermoplasmata archaeon]|nr:dienelactone hydrolase family protein [Thermoplasmata archaeon]